MHEEDNLTERIFNRDAFEIADQMLGSASTEPIRPNDFDPYRFLPDRDPLGSGAMGDVWLAKEEGVDRLVAIKLLRRTSEPDVWASREIKRLGALEHQLIARLYNHGVLQDGTPWLAMEYVEGESLDKYCRARSCSIRERLALFHEVCEAVQYAHLRGIIHGDLKPSNIRVTNDGQPKLLDFGLAEQFQNTDGTVTQSPAALGFTPAYASPEQFRGEPVGVYVDVYALGAILYELLAGTPLFDTSNSAYAEIERLQTSERKPDPPSAAALGSAGGVTKAEWRDLDAICLHAMESGIQRRYSSVEALIQDLDRFKSCEPVKARLPYTWSYRPAKFLRRNRVAAFVALIVVLAAAGMASFYTLRLARERDKARTEAARSQRIAEFMQDLFQGGDDEVGPAKDLKVVTILDKAVKETQALTRDPKVQADFLQSLGTVYESLGELDPADKLLRSALQLDRKIYGPDHEQVADTLLKTAVLRQDQGQLAESERLIRESLAMFQRHLPKNDPSVLSATILLGSMLEQRGAYDQAIQTLNQVLPFVSGKEGTKKGLANCIGLLANAYFYLGDNQRSDALNRQALDIDKELHGDRHPDVADDYVNLGQIQTRWGHYGEAEKYFRLALDIKRWWFGKDSPQTADIATYVGQALEYQGRDAEAEPLLKEALAVLQSANREPNTRVALALGELGKVSKDSGNLDDAEAYFKQEAETYRAVYGDQHQNTAIALSNLASVYKEKKQYARAEALFRDVIQRFTRVLPADNPNIGVARIKLGDVLCGEKRYQAAEGELLAGYGILIKQTSPQVSWLKTARDDLIAVYSALKQPEKAAKFREELAARK
jgi:serine/threonine-protein kinase